MVKPEIMPGTLSGRMTLLNTFAPLQPRSSAASIRRLSIFMMTVYSGIIMYGR